MSRLEIITGPMFSGKTEELIRRLNRDTVAGRVVKLFRPAIDTRYENGYVTSHGGSKLPSEEVVTPQDIWHSSVTSQQASVVGIDEAQFFDYTLEYFVMELLRKENNFKVVVACLDKDFANQNFGAIPRLMFLADRVDKLTAVCNKCGADDASFTQRLVDGKPAAFDGPTILVGGTESYEARCRDCFQAA